MMILTEMNLPDITIRRIWQLETAEIQKTTMFFENTIQPPLSFKKRTENNSRTIARICAYSLLRERIEIFFPQISSVSVCYKKTGKPYLSKPFQDVFINISHSGDYVMCGISADEIGVDIQKKRQISYALLTAIAPEIPPEKRKLMTVREKNAVFCKKESQIKALGKSVLDLLSSQEKNCNVYSFLVQIPDSNYVAYYSLYKV